MNDQQTFEFSNLDDGDEGFALVRRIRGGVGLTLSLKSNGDIEVSMPPEIAAALAAALSAAASSISD